MMTMYPSVKFGQIEKIVKLFLREATDAEKEIARRCLNQTKSSMKNNNDNNKDNDN